ncbi:hypothetical protein BGZ76_002155, partial [Entomortierella beljakovae]
MLGCQGIRLLHLFSSNQKTAQPEPRKSTISTTTTSQTRLSSFASVTIQKPIVAITKLVPASPVRRNSFEKNNRFEKYNSNTTRNNLASIDTPAASPFCEQGDFDVSTPSWTSISDSNCEDDEDAKVVVVESPKEFEYHFKIPSPAVNEETIIPQEVIISSLAVNEAPIVSQVVMTPNPAVSEVAASEATPKLVDQVNPVEKKKGVFAEYVPHRQKFEWKQGGSIVFVTGTFDNWEKTTVLSRSRNSQGGFETTLNLPRTQKILFKFIVDDNWVCSDEYATERDEYGN